MSRLAQPPSLHGADRHGTIFANSILCLDANTGQRKWHFQSMLDVWDLDFPSAPLLVTVRRNAH
ncbi:MAG: hypothetical protein WKF37_09340 [Bryobacteraceae bacterium]